MIATESVFDEESLSQLFLNLPGQTELPEFHPEFYDIKNIIVYCMDQLSWLAEKKGIQMDLVNEESIFVKVDFYRMERVLNNLLSNAIKFNETGGQVVISYEEMDGGLEIFVVDSGIGIPISQWESVFEFQPLEFFTKGTNGEDGFGYGLILCREYISLHRGRIWIEPNPLFEKGSCVRIHLPLD